MTGRVVLFGAGPGDPELITVKGARALAEADVVVYDRLVAPSLVELAPAGAERIYVGKEPGRDHLSQEEINEILVDRAARGLVVARLKGGDPFVFGRGGEEVLALAAAGAAVQVIPGVSAGTAAPAAAGIPVTHRGVARSFAVITASTADGSSANLERLVGAVDTLVFLMAGGKLEEMCARLIEAGLPASHPAAVVQWAWTPEQREAMGTLGDLAERARTARIGPPATLVVGEVAALPAEIATLGAQAGRASMITS
jgi:uroporphyrin-III C-methyltransferase